MSSANIPIINISHQMTPKAIFAENRFDRGRLSLQKRLGGL